MISSKFANFNAKMLSLGSFFSSGNVFCESDDIFSTVLFVPAHYIGNSTRTSVTAFSLLQNLSLLV